MAPSLSQTHKQYEKRNIQDITYYTVRSLLLYCCDQNTREKQREEGTYLASWFLGCPSGVSVGRGREGMEEHAARASLSASCFAVV